MSERKKCPLCTTIITKPKRAAALRENLRPLLELQSERDRFYLILWGILREHGGQITLRRPPSTEDMDGHVIDYSIDDEGSLRLSLPTEVIVEAGANIIQVAR